ncbi:MAG: pseudaminic acid cytidylyltransferase [Rhizobiaceae bacterium]
MKDQASAICIIPARGGSKRIPRKNIRPLGGLPLIAHPIRAALQCGLFARVIVTTDDEEIAAISREHGAEVPFMRDAALADDFTGTADVIVDAIERAGTRAHEYTCCLYPTAPLISSQDLVSALDNLRQSGADSLVSTTHFDFPPLRAFSVSPDGGPGGEPGGRIAFNWPEFAMTRSQDLPELVHDAGAFYWMKTATFMHSRAIVTADTIGYRLDRLKAIDIDTEEDFRIAEVLFRLATEKTSG